MGKGGGGGVRGMGWRGKVHHENNMSLRMKETEGKLLRQMQIYLNSRAISHFVLFCFVFVLLSF